METVSGGLYEGVRYAPHFNRDRPFQIVATKHDGEGSFFTEMTRSEASDLVRSLSFLLVTEGNKDG